MRIWISIGMLMATTVGAYALAPLAVPEIDAFSGMAAMGVVGSIAALIWERTQTQIRGTHNEDLDLNWNTYRFDRRRLRSDFGCA